MIRNTHSKSIKLERACRYALNCEPIETLNGIVNAAHIDEIGNAYHVIAIALAPYYKEGNENIKDKIDSFLDLYRHLSDPKMDREIYGEEVFKAGNALLDFTEELKSL